MIQDLQVVLYSYIDSYNIVKIEFLHSHQILVPV